jgi:hypothetical protein
MKTYIIPKKYRTSKFYRVQSKTVLSALACVTSDREVFREISKRKYIARKRRKYYKRLNFHLIYNPFYNP